ncbi:MAG: DEAD/DEAH box helicase [Planctomycetota bacterium]|nr:DEAD/DEAH box helicase [Planctomycetota bacterium]
MSNAPTTFRGLTLFPFQRKAIAAIFSGRGVLVAAPTGAGKTLVADFAIEQALSDERRVVYTSPIKALSNQKFRDFREAYGEKAVGLMTGDVTINPDAPLLIMTTEIYRNTIFESPRRLDGFDFAIFDEVHYLDDRERGTVWEEALIYMPPHIRPVALSATVPNVQELADWLAAERGLPVDVIVEEERPVPLTHKTWIPGRGPRNLDEVRKYFGEKKGQSRDRRGRHAHKQGHRPHRGPKGRRPRRKSRREIQRVLDEASYDLIDYLEKRDLMPAIYFCFSRKECEARARDNQTRRLLKPDERRRMLALFDDLAARYEVTDAESTRILRGLAGNGVLYHHAGMLPIDKEIVERLFTTGMVKLLFATETFALGVNMPARTVCFHSLTKYDGISRRRLLARDYWQMAGRAGRQGIDKRGFVFSILDETEITHADLDYLQSGRTEPVRSRFNLNYSAILNLYKRVGDRVPDAWERSLARFQHASGKKGGKKGGNRNKQPGRRGRHARLIDARLTVLKDLAYIVDGGLSRKGALCARINGYEVAVTEAYDEGFLFRCDPVQAAMLFASIVYEARPADQSAGPTRHLKGIMVPFSLHMEAVAQHEASYRIHDVTRGPDFGLAGVVQRFAEGMSFDEVLDFTTLAPGDLVRTLRMTIQLLRQTAHALPAGDPVAAVLHEARNRIDRDVVDAKRQLELG